MDIIVDIDGTLADCTHRLHLIRPSRTAAPPGHPHEERNRNFKPDWPAFFDACHGDTPIWPVIAMVQSLRTGTASPQMDNRLVFCSGRPERTRVATTKWLLENNLLVKMPGDAGHGWPLYMRADGDFREDSIIKRELLAKIREDGFNPVLAIDDRKRVVDMWRAEGLVCAQVAEGEF